MGKNIRSGRLIVQNFACLRLFITETLARIHFLRNIFTNVTRVKHVTSTHLSDRVVFNYNAVWHAIQTQINMYFGARAVRARNASINVQSTPSFCARATRILILDTKCDLRSSKEQHIMRRLHALRFRRVPLPSREGRQDDVSACRVAHCTFLCMIIWYEACAQHSTTHITGSKTFSLSTDCMEIKWKYAGSMQSSTCPLEKGAIVWCVSR